MNRIIPILAIWSRVAVALAAEAPATAPAADSPATRPAAHPVFAVVRQFLSAVDAGDFERARKLCVPGRFPDAQVRTMKDAFRLDNSKVLEARVGQERAAAVTDETPSRLPDRLGTRWGLYLRMNEGRWLISDLDLVLDAKAGERYLGEFQKVEPESQKRSASE
jgi:hypothetical protein